MINLTPERALLLLVGRRRLSAAEQELLRTSAGQELDWESICSLATLHGLMPLLQKQVALAKVELPQPVATKLKQESLFNVQSNLYLTSALLELNRALRSNNIRGLFFKGVVLSMLVYGELSLRQAGDIDVLIRNEDFERVSQLLETLGYQMRPRLSRAQRMAHFDSHCEIQFERDGWFTVVDLHWRLAPKGFAFPLETDELLKRAQTVVINDEAIETLSLEDTILYQCLHGAKHAWRRVEGVSCLAELTRLSGKLDWQVIIERAAKANSLRRVAVGLCIAQQMAAAAIPANVLKQLDPDSSARRLSEEYCRRIWTKDLNSPGPFEIFKDELRIMDRKRDAYISLMRAALIPTVSDWEALSLPNSLYPMYYIYRPLRLAGAFLSRSKTQEPPTKLILSNK